MKKMAFAFATVLIAGTAGVATSASACSDRSARIEGMLLAQATVITPAQPTDQTPAQVRRQQMNQMSAATTGQGAAEPGKIDIEANPASNLPGRTPGSSASPGSQEANPSRNSSH